VHPAAQEIPGNGKDDDCDPSTPDATGTEAGPDGGGDSQPDGGLKAAGGGGCGCRTGGRAKTDHVPAALFFCILLLAATRRRRT
jgi:hypothetical protein